MQLFNFDKTLNLLPNQGTVNYFGAVFTKMQADYYYNYLLNNILWKNDEAIIFGKHLITARKVAWYSETETSYTYSKITRSSQLFTAELTALKQIVEDETAQKYNSCLLNLYHNGNEGMAWHSDGEKELLKNGAIASVSFGAERKFAFKHKISKETISLNLAHGSVLVMKDETQSYWLHRLPPTAKVLKPRINLTFRTMI
jgi:alkylated DNA repair dioxygenase AlkB